MCHQGRADKMDTTLPDAFGPAQAGPSGAYSSGTAPSGAPNGNGSTTPKIKVDGMLISC